MAPRSALVCMIGVAAALICSTAAAQDRYYLGGAIGRSDMRQACDSLPSNSSCEKTDTAFKIFGGYEVTRNWAVELELTDFGKAAASGTVLGVPASGDLSAKGVGLLGVGSWPLSAQLDLFGKFGVFMGSVESNGQLGASGSANASGRSTKPMFGVGAGWNFSRTWAARLEWVRYDKVGTETAGQTDVDLFSVGAVYKF